MHNVLRLVRVFVATLTLAVASTLSPVAAQESQGLTVTDKSPTGELTFWNGIKDSNDVGSFKTYLKNFPNGMFYDLALARYQVLGGNVADVKPDTKSGLNHKVSVKTLSSGKRDTPKVKNVVVMKQHAPMLQKKIVLNKAQKKAHVHLFKKIARKHIVTKPKPIIKRKSVAPSREGGGGGGGGGGSGGGGNWG